MKTVNLYICNASNRRFALLEYKGHTKELTCSLADATGTEMALDCIQMGLQALNQPCNVELYVSNIYVASAFRKNRIQEWAANDWKKINGEPIAHIAQWQQIKDLIETHSVKTHFKPSLENLIPANAVAPAYAYDQATKKS